MQIEQMTANNCKTSHILLGKKGSHRSKRWAQKIEHTKIVRKNYKLGFAKNFLESQLNG